MINRKAALVASREGQWIYTKNMQGLRLNARFSESSLLRVCQLIEGREAWIQVSSPGIHLLEEAEWTRLVVVEGPHESVHCLLESREAA